MARRYVLTSPGQPTHRFATSAQVAAFIRLTKGGARLWSCVVLESAPSAVSTASRGAPTGTDAGQQASAAGCCGPSSRGSGRDLLTVVPT